MNTIVPFGDRSAIREVADRLTKMMPGMVRLSQAEALTVAQIAVAHGLDPFNGEVWGLKGENDKWYGVMVGIKGLRKCARRQASQEGGTYWIEFCRVGPEKYAAPANAIIYECHLRDTVTMQAYGKSLYALTQAGIPYAEAVHMLGEAPVFVGVGIATPEERSKMPIHARAKKRAEADAIRRRYDVQLLGVDYVEASDNIPNDAVMPMDNTDSSDIINVIDGDFVKTRTEAQIMAELGFDEPPQSPPPEPPEPEPSLPPEPPEQARPYPPETVRQKLLAYIDTAQRKGWKPDEKVRNMIAVNLEACFGTPDAVDCRHTVLRWLLGKASTAELTDAEVVAVSRWLDAKPDSGGQWLPNAYSVQEAQEIYTRALEDEGQQRLM